MGFLPYHIRKMSLWDYSSALSGYNKSNSPEQGRPKSPSMDTLNRQIADSISRDKKSKEDNASDSNTSS